jgi:hypothetical protein
MHQGFAAFLEKDELESYNQGHSVSCAFSLFFFFFENFGANLVEGFFYFQVNGIFFDPLF